MNNEIRDLSSQVRNLSEAIGTRIGEVIRMAVDDERGHVQRLASDIMDDNMQTLDKRIWDLSIDVENVQRGLDENEKALENAKVEIFKVVSI